MQDVVNGAKTITQLTGKQLDEIAVAMLDVLGLDDRQIMMACNRLISDARARQQTAKAGTLRFWRAEVAKWTNVKIRALALLKKRIEDAQFEAAVLAAGVKEES